MAAGAPSRLNHSGFSIVHEEQFDLLCRDNRDLRLELSAEGVDHHAADIH